MPRLHGSLEEANSQGYGERCDRIGHALRHASARRLPLARDTVNWAICCWPGGQPPHSGMKASLTMERLRGRNHGDGIPPDGSVRRWRNGMTSLRSRKAGERLRRMTRGDGDDVRRAFQPLTADALQVLWPGLTWLATGWFVYEMVPCCLTGRESARSRLDV